MLHCDWSNLSLVPVNHANSYSKMRHLSSVSPVYLGQLYLPPHHFYKSHGLQLIFSDPIFVARECGYSIGKEQLTYPNRLL